MMATNSSTANLDPESEIDFGFQRVRAGEKQGMVNDVFHKVASRYDLMNDFMSAGLHRAWKDVLVAKTGVRPGCAFRHLDVAGGTGDVAFRIARLGGRDARITVLDINPDMLAEGERRASKNGFDRQVDFVEANAETLPFPDKTFDAYTIAFGIRNVPARQAALGEAYRVLKRGGRFLCLEFSEVDIPFLEDIYRNYSFSVIPAVGKMVAGDGEPYRYLVESIAEFPTPEAFRAMVAAAGFQRSSFVRLSGGIVAIHSGWKL